MDLKELKEALINPELYPEKPDEVKTAETHVSLVFLTGRHAYKVKKAVDFGFLNYTTLERRKYFCEKEVELNQRLSPEIYIGVVRITKRDGLIGIEGEGDVVEYAVKMVQIPDDRMMDRCLSRGVVIPSIIERIANRLVHFYASSETGGEIDAFGLPERIRQDTDENFEQTLRYIGITISRDTYEKIQNATNLFLGERAHLFVQRIREGRIRDCHGDLRLEHICLMDDEIAIIDCIEFNDRFRYTDVASDIAFLAMDLDYHERPDLSKHLIQTIVRRSGDQGLMDVLDFYKTYRAYVRGKVESFLLDDPNITADEKEKALNRAKRYFLIAREYLKGFCR